MGSDSGKLLADAIKAHPNYTQIAMSMFNGKTDVDMSNKGLDAGDAFIIAAALEKNDQVQYLEVSKNALRAAGAKAISEMLKVNKTLTKLDLSDNEIGAENPDDGNQWKGKPTPEGPAALADALKSNSVLQHLNVSQCHLGTEGGKAMAACIADNSTITSVSPLFSLLFSCFCLF